MDGLNRLDDGRMVGSPTMPVTTFRLPLRYRWPCLVGVALSAVGALLFALCLVVLLIPLIMVQNVFCWLLYAIGVVLEVCVVWITIRLFLADRRTRLDVSARSVMLRTPRVNVNARWDEFIGVGPVWPLDAGLGSAGELDGLLLAAPTPVAGTGLFAVRRAIEVPTPPLGGIPLAWFEPNWREGHLGRLVRSYASRLLSADTPPPANGGVGLRRDPGGWPAAHRIVRPMWIWLPISAVISLVTARGGGFGAYTLAGVVVVLQLLSVVALVGAELVPRERFGRAKRLRWAGVVITVVSYACFIGVIYLGIWKG